MPLTEKGEEIKSNMEKEYGPEKGEEVFYASKNAGTVSGVDAFPIDDLGKSVLHAVDAAEFPIPGQIPGIRVTELGQSVLHAIDGNGGGNSGAVLSPTPELGQSAYQRGVAPDRK